jgi:hypothetical protein
MTTISFAGNYNVIITKELNNYKIGDGTENPPTEPDKILRNMCFDILNRGESIGDGIYTVDPDGDGTTYNSKSAYCDMTNGGWTLFDSFGTELKQLGSANPPAFNGNNLNTGTATRAAGYETYLDQINISNYHREAAYMQWHEGYAAKGYIKKNMPSWADIEIRIDSSNEWSSSVGTQALYYDNVKIHDIAPKSSHNSYIINTQNSGKEFKMEETGLFWIDSVWIK